MFLAEIGATSDPVHQLRDEIRPKLNKPWFSFYLSRTLEGQLEKLFMLKTLILI